MEDQTRNGLNDMRSLVGLDVMSPGYFLGSVLQTQNPKS